jgi:DNA-directed RNA polymerase specialized sigma54-like protein
MAPNDIPEDAEMREEDFSEPEPGLPDSDEGYVAEHEPTDEETFVETEAVPPSRLQILARRALLWTVGLLGVFALGVAATWFTQVTRLQRENASLRAEIETVEAEAETDMAALREELQAEKAALQAEMQEDIDSLSARLEEVELQIELLDVLVDVSSAQVAFKLEDEAGVRAALAGTDDRLAALQQKYGPDGAAAVQALRDRLETALDELGQDAQAVEEALERLSVNLLALERSLYDE